MKIAATAIALLLFTIPAQAEDSYWPGEPEAGTSFNGGSATAVKSTATTYNVWNDIFVPFGSSAAATGADKGGQSPTSAADLDKLQRSYRDYWMRRHQELTAGNQWADVLPVRIHERLNRKAFGSPVMGGDQ